MGSSVSGPRTAGTASRFRGRSLAPAATMAAVLGLLTVVVGAGPLDRFDLEVTRTIQARPSALLDQTGEALLLFGSAEAMSAFMLAVAAIVWRGYGPGAAGLVVAGYVAALVVELGVKLLLPHAGPPAEFNRYARIRPPSGDLDLQNSYPSGHAVRVAYLAVVVNRLVAARTLRTAAAALVVVVCIGRVYMGAHWLSDVAGGVLLGFACALAVLALNTRARRSRTIAGT
ncbi:MAG: phosphatase PAP2 family protein [Chloroflexi bacterium]|nr:phosphatase PAP2 family protein [Chloroflexota bacterium]